MIIILAYSFFTEVIEHLNQDKKGRKQQKTVHIRVESWFFFSFNNTQNGKLFYSIQHKNQLK